MTGQYILLEGAHHSPASDGGMCVNEAAIIAAGLKHRAVYTAGDCPKSFSRVIARYTIALNDAMSDALRQELLMPFVMRIAGSADTKSVEAQRRDFITIQTVRRILPLACREGFSRMGEPIASFCQGVKTIEQARAGMRMMRYIAKVEFWTALKRAAAFWAPVTGASVAWICVYAFKDDDILRRRVFEIATEILDGALQIGNQAPARKMIKRAERIGAVMMKMAA